jgi:hypothetical protein
VEVLAGKFEPDALLVVEQSIDLFLSFEELHLDDQAVNLLPKRPIFDLEDAQLFLVKDLHLGQPIDVF